MTTTTLQINQFTRIPNNFFHLFKKLTEGQLRAFLALLRQTIGFNRIEAKLSLSRLSEEAGITKKTVISAIRKLEELKVLKVSDSYDRNGRLYSLIGVTDIQSTGKLIPPRKGVVEKPIIDKQEKRQIVKTTSIKSVKKEVKHSPLQKIKQSNVVVRRDIFENNETCPTPEKVSVQLKILVKTLIGHGVVEKVAQTLVRTHSPDVISRQLDYIDDRSYSNKPALLVEAIKSNFSPPRNAIKRQEVEEELKRKAEHRQREEESLELARQSTHIKTPGGTLLAIHSIRGENIDFYRVEDTGRRILDSRPIHILIMTGCNFISEEEL